MGSSLPQLWLSWKSLSFLHIFFSGLSCDLYLLTLTFHWTPRDHEVSLVQVFWKSMVCLFGGICEGRSVWHHRIIHLYWWSIKLHQPLPHPFPVLDKMTDVFFFSEFCIDHSNSNFAVIKCSCIFHPASDSPLFFLFGQFIHLGFSLCSGTSKSNITY